MDRSLFANGCIVDAKPTDLRASMVTNAVVGERAVPESCAKNVAFSVVSCSSQDDDFPASELNKGVVGRGWQSARFCYYPQELVVNLQFPTRVINMQLLCHEFKIPSKVEIYVGLAPYSEQTAGQMKRLGYFSLDPNDRSGHQARELKSIHVDSAASSVRLVLHSCYTNKLNAHNQVGIVALIITGDPSNEQQLVQHQNGLTSLVQTPSVYEATSQESDSSSMSMSRSQESFGTVSFRKQLTASRVTDGNLGSVDTLTASRIRKLLQEKTTAVLEEDYDEAKRLKALIERLNMLGEKIKDLEVQKQSAVEEEDYDTAKVLKLEVQKLRQASGFPYNGTHSPKAGAESEHDGRGHSKFKDEITIPSHPVSEESLELVQFSGNMKENIRQSFDGRMELVQFAGDRKENVRQIFDGRPELVQFAGDKKENVRQSLDVRTSLDSSDVPGIRKDNLRHSFEERKSFDQAGAAQKADNGHISGLKQEIPTQLKSIDQTASNIVLMAERPPPELLKGGPGVEDLLVPEPLPDSVLKELGPAVGVIGQHRFECLYSKQWQLRDRTLQELEKDMLRNKLKGDSLTAFRAVNKVLLRALGDKVSNVFHTSLQLLRSHVTKYAEEVPTRDLQTCLADLAVILIEKMGDSNARIKEDASKTVMFITSKKEIGLPVMAPLLLKPAKSLAIWKPILGRLQLLLYAIPMFGLLPQSRLGFNADALMAFVVQGFSSPNGDVRNAAVKVTTEVYKLMGPQVEKFLKGIKSAIREVLTANFDKVGNNAGVRNGLPGPPQPEVSPRGKRPSLKSLIKADNSVDTKQARDGEHFIVAGHGKVRNSHEDRQATTSFSRMPEDMTKSMSKIPSQLTGQDSYAEMMQLSHSKSPSKVRGPKPRQAQQNGVDVFPQDQAVLETSPSKGRGQNGRQKGIDMAESGYQQAQDPYGEMMQSGQQTSPTKGRGSNAQTSQQNGVDQSQSGFQQAQVRLRCPFREEPLPVHHLLSGRGMSASAGRSGCDLNAEETGRDDGQDSCLFCGMQDSRFVDGDMLDLHFCQKCPMLTSCTNCRQIVEIATLKEHFLYECTAGKRYLECQRCLQAIPEARVALHMKGKECRRSKHLRTTRCPLCQHTVQPGDVGWREHLLRPPGCAKNSRTAPQVSN